MTVQALQGADWPAPLPLAPLQGRLIRLEPLGTLHLPGLVQAGQDERVWT